MPLAIHILCAGNEVSIESLANSVLASDRLRLAPAAQAAAQESNFSLSMGDNIPHHADIVLVGKLKTHEITIRQPRWLQQLYEVAGGGGNIVVDYTDHHMAISSPQSDFYKEIAGIANRFVVPSQAMSDVLRMQVDTPITVVEDKLEFGPLPPKPPEYYSNTILWFGHGSNLKFLARLIEHWPESAMDKSLLIVSGKGGDVLLREYLFGKPVKIDLQYLEWGINTLLLAARRADAAVIPSSTDSYKKYASNNRLVTSLAFGLPTVATTLPSYFEFRDCFADLGSAVGEATLGNPKLGLSGVRTFQEHHMPRFSPHSIVSRWKDAFIECQG